jgi:hypothetical protein
VHWAKPLAVTRIDGTEGAEETTPEEKTEAIGIGRTDTVASRTSGIAHQHTPDDRGRVA